MFKNSSYPSMEAEELDMKARWDAQTLTEAEGIKADADRYNRAVEAAKKIAEEKAAEMVAASKVATGTYSYPAMDNKNESGG
jgi:hypothetical protein